MLTRNFPDLSTEERFMWRHHQKMILNQSALLHTLFGLARNKPSKCQPYQLDLQNNMTSDSSTNHKCLTDTSNYATEALNTMLFQPRIQ